MAGAVHGLDEAQRRSVVQSLAAAWHSGWEPNRKDVENVTDYAAGRIDHLEYVRRAQGVVEHDAGELAVNVIGYARVSKRDQNPPAQEAGLPRAAGAVRVLVERGQGAGEGRWLAVEGDAGDYRAGAADAHRAPQP